MPKISDPGMVAALNAAAGSHPAINPKIPLELTHSAGANVLQNAEIGRQGALTSKANSDAAEAAANAVRARALAGTAPQLTKAELTKAQAEATIAQQKADEARAEQALGTMAANSNVHGDAYLKQFVPPSMWNVVKAYARGDLGSRSGGLSTSMLPIIQHAMNYDPSASGTNFPARVKMQSDLASGDPKTAGGSLQAFERMLLHGAEVLDAGGKLNNYSSGLPAILNYPKAGIESVLQDPNLAHFNAMVRNYAPEAQKAVAGVAGGEAERQSRASSFSGSISPQALVGGLQADAKQAYDAMQATNDRYKRIMGHDIVDALSPAGRAAYDKIMAGGFDKTGKPLHPAEGWTPISGPASPGAGGGQDGPPIVGGNPNNPYGAASQAAPQVALATGKTREVPDPQANALLDAMLRSGANDDQINAALNAVGHAAVDPKQTAAARTYMAQHPDYKGGFGAATKTENQSLLNRISASPVGTGIGAAIDGGLGGFTDEATGLINKAVRGGNLSDLIAEANARKNAAYATHPTASVIGNIAGTGATALTGGMLLKGLPMVAGMGKLAPYVGGAAYGGISGAGQNNDDRVGGAAMGIATGLVGTGVGQGLAVPLGALARTAPAMAVNNGVRRMFGGRTIAPVSALSPAESDYSGALLKAGPDNVRGFLGRASDLGVPASPADAASELTSLGGQVVRRSPTAAQTAENAFLPRARGQIDRFRSAVTRDLGPVANIPQLSQDLTQQGQVAAAPLYEQAYAAPGASSVKLDDLASRPSMKAGLARAYSIAQEEGRDPRVLGFDLNGQGEVTLNKVPSFQTLDYVKRGLDDTLEQHRDPLTGRLQLNEATRAINNTKNMLLGRVDEVNPAYAAARKAYAGPVQARDALAMGQDSFSLSPDELALQAQGQSPDNLAQMQLGQRSALMARANNVRDVSNPFEATLGTPNARTLIDTLHPNNPGTANLFATRDMEGQLARSSNEILGNSKTAQRQIADQAFAGGNLGDMVSVGVDLAHGGIPVSTIAKAGLGRAGMAFRGRQLTAKADQLAPMLFNTDPKSAAAALDELLAKLTARNQFVQQMRPTNVMGMLGGGFGASAAQRF